MNFERRQDGISTEAVGRAAQAGASVALSQLAMVCADAVGVFRRHAKRRGKRRKRPDFDAPPFCREARRHGQNVKGRKIDVATGFFTGVLPRIRGKTSEPQAETRPAADALSKKMNRRCGRRWAHFAAATWARFAPGFRRSRLRPGS